MRQEGFKWCMLRSERALDSADSSSTSFRGVEKVRGRERRRGRGRESYELTTEPVISSVLMLYHQEKRQLKNKLWHSFLK